MASDEEIEEAAKEIYNLDPCVESGEYVEGFKVSPGGALTWEQAKARDVEFSGYLSSITQFAYKAARAAYAVFERQRGWRPIDDDTPADAPLLLGWWETWPQSARWDQTIGFYRSTKGGWIHSRATHWKPLDAPPAPAKTEGE